MRIGGKLQAEVLRLAGQTAASIAGQTGTSGAGDLWGTFLVVTQAGFAHPKPEYEFHPTRKWRFDWCWPDQRVALERHGGDFRPVNCPGCGRSKTVFVSRHHGRKGLEADLEKVNAAQILGWIVIQVTPCQIRDGRATIAVLDALRARTGQVPGGAA